MSQSKKEMMNRALSAMTINIGKFGVNDNVLEEIKRQLKANEIVKIKFAKNIAKNKDDYIANIRLGRGQGLRQEHEAQALGHPQQREGVADVGQRGRDHRQGEEDPGDDLQDQEWRSGRPGSGSGVGDQCRVREAGQGAGTHPEQDHPYEGEPACGVGRHGQVVENHPQDHQDDDLEYRRDERLHRDPDEIGAPRHRGCGQPANEALFPIEGDADRQRLESGAHHTNGDHPGNEQQSIVDIGAGHLLIEHGAENKHHHHRKSHVEQHRLPVPEEGHHFNTHSRQTR